MSFEAVAELEWQAAQVVEDTRKDYGEQRLRVAALLRGRLHIAVITWRGAALHVISFRKANRKEIELYERAR